MYIFTLGALLLDNQSLSKLFLHINFQRINYFDQSEDSFQAETISRNIYQYILCLLTESTERGFYLTQAAIQLNINIAHLHLE
jgi:hypothetical protein